MRTLSAVLLVVASLAGATARARPPNESVSAMECFIVDGDMIVHDLHDVPSEKDPRARRGNDPLDRLPTINSSSAC